MSSPNLDGYFDYAAATPIDVRVLSAMQPYASELFYNPSADYAPARQVRSVFDDARRKIAHCLGTKPSEIVFTAGGTEANNLAIHGVMRQFPEANIAFSAIEHDSVRKPAMNYAHQIIPVDTGGLVEPSSLEQSINDQTVLISVMYANNEIGTIQPIRKIAQKIKQIRQARTKSGNSLPLLLHVDGAQAGNYLDVHVHDLGVDLFSINGGKLYGPKQVGALFVASNVRLIPLIDGGGQERGMRSGTENIAGAVGLATALEIAQNMRIDEVKRLHELQKHFIERLHRTIPSVIINGSLKYRLSNNVHFTIPGQDNERLLILLDQQGICAAAGSACAASHDMPSHVLQALQMSESLVRSSLRFSMGRYSTKAMVDHAVSALVRKLA